MKYCRECGVELVVGENWPFHRSQNYDYICKTCKRAASAQWRKDNPEAQREWYANNRGYTAPLIVCKDCGELKPHGGHGRCRNCALRKRVGYPRPRVCSEETRRKISKSRMGHPVSEESIRKMVASREYPNGPDHHMWKGGTSFLPYPRKFSKKFREEVRERAGRICEVCGKTEEDNGKRLDVHHIDEDKFNGALDNLLVVCMSCHAQLHHPKGKQIGN